MTTYLPMFSFLLLNVGFFVFEIFERLVNDVQPLIKGKDEVYNAKISLRLFKR